LCALAMNIVTLVSSNTTTHITEQLNWAHGKDHGTRIYVSVWNFVLEQNSTSTVNMEWNADECDMDRCDDCFTGMRTAIAFASLCFLFCIPSLWFDWKRSFPHTNTWTNKIITVITNSLACIFGIISVSVASGGCVTHLENDTDGFKWFYGPAFILMVIVTILKGLCAVWNIVVPHVEIENVQTDKEGEVDPKQHVELTTVDDTKA